MTKDVNSNFYDKDLILDVEGKNYTLPNFNIDTEWDLDGFHEEFNDAIGVKFFVKMQEVDKSNDLEAIKIYLEMQLKINKNISRNRRKQIAKWGIANVVELKNAGIKESWSVVSNIVWSFIKYRLDLKKK